MAEPNGAIQKALAVANWLHFVYAIWVGDFVPLKCLQIAGRWINDMEKMAS